MLLFLIALVQICYACASMLLCGWKLRQWRHYERGAVAAPLGPLSSRLLPRPGDNAVTHALRCTASMLTGAPPAALLCWAGPGRAAAQAHWGGVTCHAPPCPHSHTHPCLAFPPKADSVNAEVYCALRRLFIERLDVPPDFE